MRMSWGKDMGGLGFRQRSWIEQDENFTFLTKGKETHVGVKQITGESRVLRECNFSII